MSAKSNICAVSIWSAVALLGCDDSQLEQAAVQKYTEQAETKRLTEVAGQATAPIANGCNRTSYSRESSDLCGTLYYSD